LALELLYAVVLDAVLVILAVPPAARSAGLFGVVLAEELAL
jgi:hypothetical protein